MRRTSRSFGVFRASGSLSRLHERSDCARTQGQPQRPKQKNGRTEKGKRDSYTTRARSPPRTSPRAARDPPRRGRGAGPRARPRPRPLDRIHLDIEAKRGRHCLTRRHVRSPPSHGSSRRHLRATRLPTSCSSPRRILVVDVSPTIWGGCTHASHIRPTRAPPIAMGRSTMTMCRNRLLRSSSG